MADALPAPASYHELLRQVLRQPGLTSDACLMVADALDDMHHPDPAAPGATLARDVAEALRALAPVYAATPLEAATAPQAPAPTPAAPGLEELLAALEDLPRSHLHEMRRITDIAALGSRASARLFRALLAMAEARHP